MVNYKEKFAEAKTIAINEGFESTRAEWLFLDVFGWSKTDYLIPVSYTHLRAHET